MTSISRESRALAIGPIARLPAARYRATVERHHWGALVVPLPPRDPADDQDGRGGQTGGSPAGLRGVGKVSAYWIDSPAQQITFSKSMNWALSWPGACLADDHSAPGRPTLTHWPDLTGSIS
jgi:hypothetical protein